MQARRKPLHQVRPSDLPCPSCRLQCVPDDKAGCMTYNQLSCCSGSSQTDAQQCDPAEQGGGICV